jgi:uncharacterized phiE125 gp8 family phage protein
MPINYLIINAVEETETGNTEPVSVSELKAFLEISGTDYDTILADLGIAARRQVEQYTGLLVLIFLPANCEVSVLARS